MRRPLAALALLAAVSLAWYLGSPLFLTSRLDEALPGSPVGAASSPAPTPAATPAASAVAPGPSGAFPAVPAPAPATSPAPSAAAPAVSVPTAAPPALAAPTVRTIASGKLGFVDAGHHGEGTVRVIETAGLRLLRFEGVTITNAPDVRIYLSKDTGGKYSAASTIDLGALKATSGSFNYEIPVGADLSAYRSVVVWCRAFSVLVTWADLAG